MGGFELREFIKKGFIDAVGKMPNYQIILNAAGWHEKGVLTEEDLAEINVAIFPEEEVVEEEIPETLDGVAFSE